MIYASVCDGIGAAHAAWKPLGWRCAWTSEIEPFPIAVVEHHHGLPNLGDMTKITEADVEKHGRIDLLVGGTPCQSFSVAGLRGGMADPRGNLALRFLQLAGTLRPAWVVWENVPGVLSSNEGRDFGAFLGALGELGYGWAYRILDARYFGVPQRRRRVFVVGYLGDWRRAASVLLERESMCGHPPPGGEAGEGTARSVAPSIGASGRGFSRAGETRGQDPVIPVESRRLNAGGLIAGTLDASFARLQGCSGQDANHGHSHLIAHALRAAGYNASEDDTGRGTPLVPVGFDWGQSGAEKATTCATEDGMPPLIGARPHAVAFQTRIGRNGRGQPKDHIDAMTSCAGGTHADSKPHVAYSGGVRRITPLEAERLQGFPDNYTLIKYRNKPAVDAPRYKALGNSMAVPCMAWIGKRIATTTRKEPPQ